jgi:phosphopantothenoylcysteine synthetase/decarboxylase
MKAIVTCGPSYEPIDDVRRLTNFSTGELGVMLANALTDAGIETICLKGEQATWPGECRATRVTRFSTNDDLLAKLEDCVETGDIDAVFHAAALCDYKVGAIRDVSGEEVNDAKIPTRSGKLTMTLVPTTKVIAKLRAIFPNAVLVGWKYELVGGRADAVAKAVAQIEANGTNACVVNGVAFGAGFGRCEPPDSVTEFPDKAALCKGLVDWLKRSRAN